MEPFDDTVILSSVSRNRPKDPLGLVDLLNGYVLDVAFCYWQDESMLVLIIYGCKPNKDPPTMEVLHLLRDIYI